MVRIPARKPYSGKQQKRSMSYLFLSPAAGQGKFKKQLSGGLKFKALGVNKADAMEEAKILKKKGYVTHIEKKYANVYGIYARKRNKI